MTDDWPILFHQDFRMTLDDGSNVSYGAVFTAQFFTEITNLMRIEKDPDCLAALQEAHCNAVSAYLDAKHEIKNQKTLQEDNKQLELLAYHADKIGMLLLGMADYPAARSRLVSQIQNNPTAYQGRNRPSLSSLLVDRTENPLLALQNLFSDLWASAERAQIKAARGNDWLGSIPGEIADMAEFSFILSKAVEPTISPDGIERTYRKKSDPILAFIRAFAQIWHALSPQTYGPGMHLRESGGTKSSAVDAVYLTLKLINPSLKRAQVVTAFRKWKETEGAASQI